MSVKDLLVRLVGERAMQRLDPLDPGESRFEWWAREARLTLSVADRQTLERGADRFVREARPGARCSGYACARSWPSRRAPAWEEGTLSQVLASAARARHAPVLDLSVAAGAGRELWDEPCDRWILLPQDSPDGRYVAPA